MRAFLRSGGLQTHICRMRVRNNFEPIATSKEELSIREKDTMTAPKSGGKTVRVAAVQAEGCYFDLDAAVKKTCKLIEEAAAKGCDLIAFPEVWIPQYPGWIW